MSLFTGQYPAEHGIRDNISQPLSEAAPLLADAFKRAGFPTAAFITSSVLDRQPDVPAPGGVQGAANLTFVGDNMAKGVSAAPALTAHADPAWSERWWPADRAATADALLELAAPYIGDAKVVEHQVKRWRFATPRSIWPERCWMAPTPMPAIVAGDAFAGPRVEGAILSGLLHSTQGGEP